MIKVRLTVLATLTSGAILFLNHTGIADGNGAATIEGMTGRQLMEKSRSLKAPTSGRSTILMKIFEGGDVVEKSFEVIAKHDQGRRVRSLSTLKNLLS